MLDRISVTVHFYCSERERILKMLGCSTVKYGENQPFKLDFKPKATVVFVYILPFKQPGIFQNRAFTFTTIKMNGDSCLTLW